MAEEHRGKQSNTRRHMRRAKDVSNVRRREGWEGGLTSRECGYAGTG